MTITPSPETMLLRGLAGVLADAGVGQYAAPGTVMPAGTAAMPTIITGRLPESSGVTIALQDYPITDWPGRPDAELGINVRIRGTADPDVARDIEGAVLRVLHGRTGLVGTIYIDQMFRTSYAELGPDPRNMVERSNNYTVQLNRPGFEE